MAVVVARQNAKKGGKKGKGGSSGPDQGELTKIVQTAFPTENKKITFRLTSEKGDASARQAYSKSMVPHALMHHRELVESSKTVSATQYDINILDLIHYHVMGDYRVVVERKSSIDNFQSNSATEMEAHLAANSSQNATVVSQQLKFAYSTLQSFNSNTDYIHSSIKLENLLRHPIREDTLYGIYSKNPADFGYTMSEVPWMSKELNSGSSGTRLMLPSIGTQIVAILATTWLQKNCKSRY